MTDTRTLTTAERDILEMAAKRSYTAFRADTTVICDQLAAPAVGLLHAEGFGQYTITDAGRELIGVEARARVILMSAQQTKRPLVEIWAFVDVAKDLQDLSPHGGDEDYVVIVRDDDCTIAWQLEGGRFLGNDHWTKHEYNGETVWIGAHA